MFSVFSTTFERAQNGAINRLHDMKRSGKIKAFILPYLGQLDSELPNPPGRRAVSLTMLRRRQSCRVRLRVDRFTIRMYTLRQHQVGVELGVEPTTYTGQ